MKKAILVLTALMLFLIVFPTTISASAENSASTEITEFEPRLSAPSRSNDYYNSTLNRYSQTGYGMPNCVAYAYGRVYEMNGEAPLITHGNAGDWWFINKSNDYYDYGSTPKLGAVVVWSNHVAVVEEINDDGSITISESHYGGTYFDTKVVYDYTYHYGQTFYGFIYTYKEPEKKKEEKPKSATAEKAPNVPESKHVFDIINLEDTNDNGTIVHNDKMLILAASNK